MPDDRDRALDVLRWLRSVNFQGRIDTDATVQFADAADRKHGQHLLNVLEGKGWVTFSGLYSQQVEITETGWNELTFRDDWVAITPTAVTTLTARARLLVTNPRLHADIVLQRIYDASEAASDRMVGCPPPEHGLTPHAVMTVLWRRLVPDGLVRITRVAPPPDLPRVALTPKGCAHVRQAREVMDDPEARCRQVRGTLLRWLHDRREDLARSRVAEFFEDSHSAYRGQFFSSDDVTDAARYLQARGLAVATGRGDRLAAHITQEGIDCVQRGADVTNLDSAADHGDSADGKPRTLAANFCGVLAGIGWAAVAALAALSKRPMSSPWFILSLVVAIAATVFFLLAGGPDLLRWLSLELRSKWLAVRGSRLSAVHAAAPSP